MGCSNLGQAEWNNIKDSEVRVNAGSMVTWVVGWAEISEALGMYLLAVSLKVDFKNMYNINNNTIGFCYVTSV